jgi:hypothetical protein
VADVPKMLDTPGENENLDGYDAGEDAAYNANGREEEQPANTDYNKPFEGKYGKYYR